MAEKATPSPAPKDLTTKSAHDYAGHGLPPGERNRIFINRSKLAEKIRAIAEKRGMTARALLKRGFEGHLLSDSAIVKLTNPNSHPGRYPSEKSLAIAARVLGTTYDDLISEIGLER